MMICLRTSTFLAAYFLFISEVATDVRLVSPPDGKVCKGSNFTVSYIQKLDTCEHKLPTSVKWNFGHTEITSNLQNHYICEFNFTLTVADASIEDAGNYDAVCGDAAIRNLSNAGVTVNVQSCSARQVSEENRGQNGAGSVTTVPPSTNLDGIKLNGERGVNNASQNCDTMIIIGFLGGIGGTIVIELIIACVYWQRIITIGHSIQKFKFRTHLKLIVWRNSVNVSYEPDENGKNIIRLQNTNERQRLIRLLESAGYQRDGFYETTVNLTTTGDRSETGRNNSVKQGCVTEVICDGKTSLFSGSLSSRTGKSYGIMVGHAAKRGLPCRTIEGKFVGTCIEALYDTAAVTPENKKITLDMAFIELNEFSIENKITVRDKRYQLKISREELKRNSEVFTICRNGKLRNGIVRDINTSLRSFPSRLEGIITITDFAGKSRITECGDSGALLMSLPNADEDKIYVHGIFVGYYEDIDCQGNIVSLDVALPLCDMLRTACQKEEIAGLFGNDINEIDFSQVSDIKYGHVESSCSDMELQKTTKGAKLWSHEGYSEVDQEVFVFSFGEAFADMRQLLVQYIDPDHGLIKSLQSKGLLTALDIADIRSHSTMSARTQRLLDILEVCDVAKFDRFNQALEETNHSHVMNCIRLQSRKSTEIKNRMLVPLAFRSEFETAFSAANRPAGNDSMFSAFLANMQDGGVMTSIQVADCESQSDSGRINLLFEILKRRPDKDFPTFCNALRKTIKWYLNVNISPNIDDSQHLIAVHFELLKLVSMRQQLDRDTLRYAPRAIDQQQLHQVDRIAVVVLYNILHSLREVLDDDVLLPENRSLDRLLCISSELFDPVSQCDGTHESRIRFYDADQGNRVIERPLAVADVYCITLSGHIQTRPVSDHCNPTVDGDTSKRTPCIYIGQRSKHETNEFCVLLHSSFGTREKCRRAVTTMSRTGESVLITCCDIATVQKFTPCAKPKRVLNVTSHNELANPQHAIVSPSRRVNKMSCFHVDVVYLIDTGLTSDGPSSPRQIVRFEDCVAVC